MNGHYYLCLTYAAIKDFLSARAVLRDASEMHAIHIASWQSLGSLSMQFKDFDEASVCFRRIMRFYQYIVRGPYHLGLTLLAVGDQCVAREAFEVAVDPGHPDSLHNLGTLYMNTGDFEGAKRVFEQTIENAPHQGHLYARLGLVHMKLQDYRERH